MSYFLTKLQCIPADWEEATSWTSEFSHERNVSLPPSLLPHSFFLSYSLAPPPFSCPEWFPWRQLWSVEMAQSLVHAAQLYVSTRMHTLRHLYIAMHGSYIKNNIRTLCIFICSFMKYANNASFAWNKNTARVLLNKLSSALLREAETLHLCFCSTLTPPLQLYAVCVGCLSFPLSHSGDFIPRVVVCICVCVYESKRASPDLEEGSFYQSLKTLVTSERTAVSDLTASIQIATC